MLFHVGATPVPLDLRTCPVVPGLLVELTLYPAGYVINTSLVPEVKLTLLPELLEASTVSRYSVVPAEV